MQALTNLNIRDDSSASGHVVRSFAPAIQLQTQVMAQVSGSTCGGDEVGGWPQPQHELAVTSGEGLATKILARRDGRLLPDSTGFIRSERDRLALKGNSR